MLDIGKIRDGVCTVNKLDYMAKDLGYRSYADYLLGDHWKRFSKSVRRKECYVCNGSNLLMHVHHITYERMGMELAEDVVTVCEGCHKEIHDLVRQRKAPLATAHLNLRKGFKKDNRPSVFDEGGHRPRVCLKCDKPYIGAKEYCGSCTRNTPIDKAGNRYRQCVKCGKACKKTKAKCRICIREDMNHRGILTKGQRKSALRTKCVQCGKWAQTGSNKCRPCATTITLNLGAGRRKTY